MLRVLLVAGLLAFGSVAHSEESGPREAENKAEASQSEQAKGNAPQEVPTPFPFWMTQQPVSATVNVYTSKHAGEESHCTEPEDWKEWGSFAVCRSWEWIDAERIIAVWTVILGIATCILGIATWRLWRSTDQLVRGAEDTSERQLRAYLSAIPFHVFEIKKDAPIAIKTRIINHGPTPANDVMSVAAIKVWPYPLPSDLVIDTPPPRGPQWTRAGTIYSNALPAILNTRSDGVLTLGDIRALEHDDSSSRVYILGVVSYFDIFAKKERTTKFCASITPYYFRKLARGESFENQDGVFEVTPRHNDST